MKHSKLWILVFISLLTGCTETKHPSVKVDPPPVMNSAPTSTIVVPSPTIHHTSTPTPTVTPTMIPTLSADQSKSLFLNLLQNNENCRFPCILGVVPGQTSKDMFREFVRQAGNYSTPEFKISHNEWDNYTSVAWKMTQEEYYLLTHFENEVVAYVKFSAIAIDDEYQRVYDNADFIENSKRFSLPQVMKDYGLPSNIFVWAWHSSDMPEPGAEWSRISLVLYYPDNGFIVEYIIPTEIVNNQFKGCAAGTSGGITTWDPETVLSLEDVLKRSYSGNGVNDYYIEILKSTDEAFNMSEEEFFQTYQDPSNTCFFTPVDLWPNFD